MKIGIISINAHTKTLNFACPLHTYAFQQFLLANGIESTIIDYMPVYYPKSYNPEYPLHWYLSHGYSKIINETMPANLVEESAKKEWKTNHSKKMITIEKYSALYNEWPLRFKKFQNFMDSHYYMTDKSYHHNDIDKKDPGFDCYICVTDVIWQYTAGHGFDKGFLLAGKTMEGKPKIGYSVSRGVYKGWNDEIIKQFIELTSPYEAIAAREASFAEHISELLHRDIPTVLDPVFLMDKDFWHQIAIPPKTTEKYVLLYTVMEKAADSVRTAFSFARRKGLKLIVLSSYEGNKAIPSDADCEILYNVGPEEWLGYIENAEYVITNSFHSCAFSILFEKEFYVGSRHGDKVDTVLKTFQLEKRRFTKEYDCTLSDDVIDYEPIRAILEEKRKFSGDFLLNAIHDVEKKYNYENSILPKKPYKVIYSSSVKNENLKCRWFLKGLEKKEEKNAICLVQSEGIPDNNSLTITKQPFSYKNHTLVGWYGKSIQKGIPKWYCTDGHFHTATEILTHDEIDVYLFQNNETTDAFAANRLANGSTFYLDAVWKKDSDDTLIPDINAQLSKADKVYRLEK